MSSTISEIPRRPFKVVSRDKIDFREWVLEQFPEITRYALGGLESYPEFEQRLTEIHNGAMLVLNRIMQTYPEPSDLMHQYYAPDFQNLPKVFETRDPKNYAVALDDFLGGIEVE